MAIESLALSRFTNQIESAPWFSSLGKDLTLEETDYASRYIKSIGLEVVKVGKIASWVKAENLIKAPDWSESWWVAEEQERKSLTSFAEKKYGRENLFESLSYISNFVSNIVHGAASISAAQEGVANSGLIRAAAGSATLASHQAALEILVNKRATGPFISKYRLFESGHWPLCLNSKVFYIF